MAFIVTAARCELIDPESWTGSDAPTDPGTTNCDVHDQHDSRPFKANRDGMLALIARMRGAGGAHARRIRRRQGSLSQARPVAAARARRRWCSIPARRSSNCRRWPATCFDVPDADKSVPGGGADRRHRLRRPASAAWSAPTIPASTPARCSPTASTRRCACRRSRWRTSCPTCSWSKAPAPICCSYRVEDFIRGGNIFRNLARLSAAGLPVVTVTHGSSTAGGAYQTGPVRLHRDGARPHARVPRRAAAAEGRDRRDRDRGRTRRRRDAHLDLRPRRLSRRGRPRRAAHRARHHGAIWTGTGRSRPTASFKPPRYDAEELLGIMPMDHKRPVDMRQVIARFVDDSDFTRVRRRITAPPRCAATPASRAMPIGIITNNGPLDVRRRQQGDAFHPGLLPVAHADPLSATTPPATWSARPTRRPA